MALRDQARFVLEDVKKQGWHFPDIILNDYRVDTFVAMRVDCTLSGFIKIVEEHDWVLGIIQLQNEIRLIPNIVYNLSKRVDQDNFVFPVSDLYSIKTIVSVVLNFDGFVRSISGVNR